MTEPTIAVAAPSTHRSGLLIIVLAYAAFIGLGLSNSLLGVAWPSIRATFGLPIDAVGALLFGSTIGYMAASALSGRLLTQLRGGVMLSLSCGLGALAFLASGGAPSWAIMVGLGVLAGASAGITDGGLNAYAAAHFSPRAMNWLHACFGIGATLGPAIMTGVIALGLGWRAGYGAVGAILLLLALAFAFTRQLWADPPSDTQADTPAPVRGAPLLETLRLPIAWLGILLFFMYTGAEVGLGNWLFSLLTEARGVRPELAGIWVSLYWASLTLGRIVFGVVVSRISPTTLLRGSMLAAVLGTLLIWANIASWLTFGGIALMGIALAPQFPLLISATPGFLGPRHAANGVGLEVASASVGGALLPSAIGVLAATYGLEVLGPCLLVAALAMAGLFELLVRRTNAATQAV